MRSLMIEAVVHPLDVRWWQWGKISGLLLPILCLSFGVQHPLVWAVAVHLLMDFTLQSDRTAAGKARGNWRMLVNHAFISGGYAGLIVGGLAGLFASAIVHLIIDSTNKFGLEEPLGPALDQALHILTLIAIWWLL